MSVSKAFDWPKGAVEQAADLVLARGMLIHGKVTEHGSGKPVAGARMSFSARSKPGAGSTNSSTQCESCTVAPSSSMTTTTPSTVQLAATLTFGASPNSAAATPPTTNAAGACAKPAATSRPISAPPPPDRIRST